MGDPKFPRKRYDTPFHPWKADRIQEEKGIEHKYGLKNKKEVWRAKSHLRGFRQQARGLLARSRTGDVQAQKEATLLLAKLNRQGLLSDKATLDDVLALGIDQLLSRRLQTQVYLKGYTTSIDQARQFIAHGHVTVGDTRMNVPGYYLKRGEEEAIILTPGRPVADDAHVARPKRAEGGGPVRLREYKPRTPERGFGGRGGPGGGRGPPRGGGGFRGPGGGTGGSGGGFRGGPRGPPSGPAPGAPAPEAAAAAGAREEQVAKKKRADDAAKSQGGGAF